MNFLKHQIDMKKFLLFLLYIEYYRICLVTYLLQEMKFKIEYLSFRL